MPILDKTILAAYRVRYEGETLQAALKSLEEYPTFKEDCAVKRAKKEDLRMQYMKQLLKEVI